MKRCRVVDAINAEPTCSSRLNAGARHDELEQGDRVHSNFALALQDILLAGEMPVQMADKRNVHPNLQERFVS
jgi:hypothetical protein